MMPQIIELIIKLTELFLSNQASCELIKNNNNNNYLKIQHRDIHGSMHTAFLLNRSKVDPAHRALHKQSLR